MKKIKIITNFVLVLFIISQSINAQNNIEITPFVSPSVEYIPLEAQGILTNKLAEILTQNGVIKGINSRFIITANTNVLTKEITSTIPQLEVIELQLTYFIGNGIDGNVFSSNSTTLKGVGITQTKAYIDAFKNMSAKNKDLSEMITKAKGKIIEYYNSKCASILNDAETLEKIGKFEEALYQITAIPDACTECYNKANQKTAAIFQKVIETDCKSKIAEANNVWNANPNEFGANQASKILMKVNPNANCFGEIKLLAVKIEKKLNEIDQRNFKVFYEQQIGLEKDRIEAAKVVGKAFGEGQPKNITYNTRGWW